MFASSDWNVDLIPKFLMANGRLVQLLIHTGSSEWPVLMMTLNNTLYFLFNAFTLLLLLLSSIKILHRNHNPRANWYKHYHLIQLLCAENEDFKRLLTIEQKQIRVEKQKKCLLLLRYAGVTRYLEFKSVEGSYVLGKSGKISKVS